MAFQEMCDLAIIPGSCGFVSLYPPKRSLDGVPGFCEPRLPTARTSEKLRERKILALAEFGYDALPKCHLS